MFSFVIAVVLAFLAGKFWERWRWLSEEADAAEDRRMHDGLL